MLSVPQYLPDLYRKYKAMPLARRFYFLNACGLYQKSRQIVTVFPSAAMGALVSAAETLGGLRIRRKTGARQRFLAATQGLLDEADPSWRPFLVDLYDDRCNHQHEGHMLGDELSFRTTPFETDYSWFQEKYQAFEFVMAKALVAYVLDSKN